MGMLIGFPEREGRSRKRLIAEKSESAKVIILPVIRIERFLVEPVEPVTRGHGRRRRRRASRS